MFTAIYFQVDRNNRVVAQGDDGQSRLARIAGRWTSVEAMKVALARRGLVNDATVWTRC
jgi:hypothetical protein